MRPLWTPPLDAARQAATKGWRWLAEMEQLAATFTASGLPDGFAVAAAELYARPDRVPDALADSDTLEAVLAALTGSGR